MNSIFAVGSHVAFFVLLWGSGNDRHRIAYGSERVFDFCAEAAKHHDAETFQIVVKPSNAVYAVACPSQECNTTVPDQISMEPAVCTFTKEVKTEQVTPAHWSVR